MIENTKYPPDGYIEENMLEINVKFNLMATRSKIDALKTKTKHNICNNTIKGLVDLKRNILNIQLRNSRWAIDKILFVSFSISHCY